MSKQVIDLIVRIAIEIVDYIAKKLREERGNENHDGKGASETKREV